MSILIVFNYSDQIIYNLSIMYSTAGLEIHFCGGSKLLLPGSKLGSKTNFVVATF